MRAYLFIVTLATLVGAAAPAMAQKAKPYAVVKVTLPEPIKDNAFDAFRRQVAETAKKKDRDALGKLVVEANYFWVRESGDTADKAKPGIDYLASALALDAKDGAGWDTLSFLVSDFIAAHSPDQKGALCAPAAPNYVDDELRNVVEKTNSDVADWAYTLRPDIQVRASGAAEAPVIETLGMQFVHVLEEADPPGITVAQIATPSGKTGYVPGNAIAPLAADQLCFTKDAAGVWKIAGYIGSGEAK